MSEDLKKNNVKNLTARIFARILYKMKFCNNKSNKNLLGIDILKTGIQKNLFAISILRVEETYTKLIENPASEEIMQKKGKIIFLQCLKKVCEDFLTNQYGYKVRVDLDILKKSLYTKNLLKDLDLIFKVPFFILLDPESSVFRLIYYPVYNFASESFIEALIDHVVLEICNCVVYFSIVKFSSIYAVRQTLYRSKFLSLRNLERFKNNLNWQLINNRYIKRPTELYNNRYEIFIIRTNGIYCQRIYANRSKQITSLGNLSLLTLTLLELRDFSVCRLDEIVYFLSKGARFTLTSVFGRIIGLIWRGVIEGLKTRS